MKALRSPHARRLAWVVGGFGGSFVFRLGSNVVLSRLLVPEIFGIMAIVNSIKFGVEMLSDVGVEQNIVTHKEGASPDFFNTAWTVQIIRGALLTGLFLAATPLLAGFFHLSPLIFAVVAFAPLVNALASTSIFLLVKQLDVGRRNRFELTADFMTFAINVSLALVTQTYWAPVIGMIASLAARSALSYRIAHPPHRLLLRRDYVRSIVSFGKWVMLSSLVIYAATNLDRIYLGRVAPLALLGIYGLARTISDLPWLLASRLAYQLVFPMLASAHGEAGAVPRAGLAKTRRRFIWLGALALGSALAWTDVAVAILYDARYQQAGWMLFALMVGTWFAVLSSLNEALLIGFSRPAYVSAANVTRLVALAAGLPAGYGALGMPGAVAAIVVAEVARYLCVGFGQQRIGYSFWRQDGAATLVWAASAAAWLALRHWAGLGMPWASLAAHGWR